MLIYCLVSLWNSYSYAATLPSWLNTVTSFLIKMTRTCYIVCTRLPSCVARLLSKLNLFHCRLLSLLSGSLLYSHPFLALSSWDQGMVTCVIWIACSSTRAYYPCFCFVIRIVLCPYSTLCTLLMHLVLHQDCFWRRLRLLLPTRHDVDVFYPQIFNWRL